MTFARKILLHCPISDESLLDGFVEQCLRDDVSIIAVAGDGSARIEELIDWIVIGDGSDANRFVCTTSHPDESVEDVLIVLETWEMDRADSIQEVRL